MPSLKQTSFHGGELSPLLWGRTDLPNFGKGARTLRNFFVSREGAAVSRPGSTYIATTKSGQPVRLIPFIFSDSTSYVLEFGAGYIRFFTDGAPVLDGGGNPYEVATTYTYAELTDLNYAQVGDTLQLVHPGHAPAELRRYAEATWALTDVSFALPAPYWHDVGDPATTTHEFAMAPNATQAPGVADPLWQEDPTHPRREWKWAFTALMQRRTDGVVVESLPVYVTQKWDGATEGTLAALADNDTVLFEDAPIVLSRCPYAAPPALPAGWGAATDYAILSFLAYRGRGDLLGLVGTTKTRTFVDLGEEPNYAIQPPRGTNPFVVLAPDGSTVRTETPRAVTFFEQRRLYAGTTERPGFTWFSATGDFYNHDAHLVHVADEALEFELASYKRETVRQVLGQDRAIIGTDASIWSAQGTQGSPLSFDAYRFRQEVGIGINHMPFLVVDNGAVLYARAKGHGVRDLLFDAGRDGLASRDVSLVSQHLFIGDVFGFPIRSIVFGRPLVTNTVTNRDLRDWTYAEDPWGLVWAVRNDGVLLSLTYSKDGGYSAWARHDHPNGGYLSVCAVPETTEDAVYVAVRRTRDDGTATQCYIERFTSRVSAGRATDGNALDSAVLYQGATTDTFTGLEHLEGLEVYATGPNLPVYGPHTVVGGSITLDEAPAGNTSAGGFYHGHALPESYATALPTPGLTLYIGLPFVADLGLLDLAQAEARLKVKNVKRVGFEVDNSRGLQVGEDFNTLKDWEPREVDDSYDGVGLRTELVEMLVASSWNQGGRAVLRQSQPIATTVLGITREVELGG